LQDLNSRPKERYPYEKKTMEIIINAGHAKPFVEKLVKLFHPEYKEEF